MYIRYEMSHCSRSFDVCTCRVKLLACHCQNFIDIYDTRAQEFLDHNFISLLPLNVIELYLTALQMLQDGKAVLVKAVGVVDASADTVFEVIFNIDRQWRYEYVAHFGICVCVCLYIYNICINIILC